ncbi:GNAT family N-acetyltransferase [Lampropedia puyangensis]|uniref:GNAT family N-acetyltransferase n=1 Tax=Lampropedia puyangensis TaxID=1330072 RepID=A0A4S8EXW7_9BURK|nr:GNAT family N-acetyltransferase [Lampropedia puyangensis]THT98734.1 GNAT family N-acetyltransferase [Lampropedia puyangensis]
MTITIRPLTTNDSMEALTTLLHTAYATLATQGWNFTAATQSAETTRERATQGQCFIAENGTKMVGTISIAPPKPANGRYLQDAVPELYADFSHAILAQLAVHPEARGQGIAERLLDCAEKWAHDHSFSAVALDTAEPATALRARYQRRGYSDAGHVQWSGKTYASVLMRKALHPHTATSLFEATSKP